MDNVITLALSHPAAIVVANIVLTFVFWMAGLFGLFNFKAIVQEMVDVNLPSPRLFAVATIATQLVGSTLAITHYRGAGLAWRRRAGGVSDPDHPDRAPVLDVFRTQTHP